MGQESFFLHILPQPTPFGASIELEVSTQQILANVEVMSLKSELDGTPITAEKEQDPNDASVDQETVIAEKCDKC